MSRKRKTIGKIQNLKYPHTPRKRGKFKPEQIQSRNEIKETLDKDPEWQKKSESERWAEASRRVREK